VKLADLEPHFLKILSEDTYQYAGVSFSEAQGVQFLCPVCFVTNGGAIGTHFVLCWSRSRGTPEHFKPGPGRWKLDGTGLADLTLNADPPATARSVRLSGGCNAHFCVTNGEIT
jgi:hypothetical protein